MEDSRLGADLGPWKDQTQRRSKRCMQESGSGAEIPARPKKGFTSKAHHGLGVLSPHPQAATSSVGALQTKARLLPCTQTRALSAARRPGSEST